MAGLNGLPQNKDPDPRLRRAAARWRASALFLGSDLQVNDDGKIAVKVSANGGLEALADGLAVDVAAPVKLTASGVGLAATGSGRILVSSGVDTWAEKTVGQTAGSVLFVDASGNLSQDNAALFWDVANKRLGIGTTTPANLLTVEGNVATAGKFASSTMGTDGGTAIGIGGGFTAAGATTSFVLLGGYKNNATDGDFGGYFVIKTRINGGAFTERLRVSDAGDVGIGTTPVAGNKLKVATVIATTTGLIVQGAASQSANLQEWVSASAVYGTVSENGYFTTRKTSAPVDGELVAGELAWWFDSTDGAAKVRWKGKQADGTVRTAELAMA